MSLIQEALRRKAEDTGGLVPPPMPSPVTYAMDGAVDRSERRSGPPKAALAAVALSVVALVGAASFLVAKAVGAWGDAGGVVDTAAAAPAAVAAAVPETASPEAVEATAAPSETTPLPPALSVQGATLSAGEAPPPAPADEDVGLEAGAAAPSPAETVVEPMEAAAQGDWPAVRINGVMLSQKTEKSAAIINERVVNLNGNVGGARLVDVSDAGVVLELNGESRFFEVGAGDL